MLSLKSLDEKPQPCEFSLFHQKSLGRDLQNCGHNIKMIVATFDNLEDHILTAVKPVFEVTNSMSSRRGCSHGIQYLVVAATILFIMSIASISSSSSSGGGGSSGGSSSGSGGDGDGGGGLTVFMWCRVQLSRFHMLAIWLSALSPRV